ncbi:proheparin-binding EGF-like growth factor [Carassius auratus]|uniref:Proheparin-binding EGF-like growth factor n=1 Tax=Carassius auratus TaxID=7957 RepID=A0A6P6IVG4_CARAU|nr:proheparin-binding EGF-like growth factor [Carassius auratus]XP_052444806.1 proheparin-binding EGF-like growth factor [Carassius gibelio]
MNTLRITVFLVHCLVLLKVCSGASVDRYESAKPRTTVDSLFHTLEKTNTTGHQVDRGTNDYDEDYDLSVDYDSNQPRVAFSTKPKHPSAIPTTEKKTKKGKRKGKGRGNRRKKNPCLEEYKDFCIHGVCQHLKELNTHSCVCQVGYSGERCHLFTLGVSKKEQRYSRTTALAVIAVVLSLTCLTVIVILLALRYHKKDDADEESAEVIREERKMEPKRTDGTEEKQGHNC